MEGLQLAVSVQATILARRKLQAQLDAERQGVAT
jgi:hypothetical protein